MLYRAKWRRCSGSRRYGEHHTNLAARVYIARMIQLTYDDGTENNGVVTKWVVMACFGPNDNGTMRLLRVH